jgi:hypothetical protein
MTLLERITAVLQRARMAGGWIDEDVAEAVLAELALDEDGAPLPARCDPIEAEIRRIVDGDALGHG